MKFLVAFIFTLYSVSLLAQTSIEITWLNAHISTIKTVSAGNSQDDLHALKSVVKEATIVAMGECTHGSREIFQLKHRLLEYMVEEMHFSVFAMEADLASAGIINDFILTGKGDSTKY